MQKLYTKIKLEIIGADIVIEGADIKLEIKKTNEGQPNYCTCTIYNVSDNTYNTLLEKTNSVRVYTDTDDNGYVLAFQGDLRDIKKWKKFKATKRKSTKKKIVATKIHYNAPPITRQEDNNNITTVLELQDGIKDFNLNYYYSQSYSGSISNKKILNDILYFVKKHTTVAVGQIDDIQERIYPKGYIAQGTLGNILRKVCRTGGCNCIIENNMINILKNSNTSDIYGYYLHSGICPRPEFETDKEISVVAPFLSTINVGNYIKLDFEDIQGTYKIKKIDSEVDTFGENYSTKLILDGNV